MSVHFSFAQVCDVNDHIYIAYVSHIKSHSVPLKLLVENELCRLSVWSNPVNDPKRGPDYPINLEKSMTDVSYFNYSLS